VYRVSRDAVRSFSKLLETLTLVRVTYAHVWARVVEWVGEEEKNTYCCYAYRLYFLKCDMYKSSLRHIHDPVLSSLKMEGILSFYASVARIGKGHRQVSPGITHDLCCLPYVAASG
jgi:hypothetical protein